MTYGFIRTSATVSIAIALLLGCGCSRIGGQPEIATPAQDELPMLRPLRLDRPDTISLEFRTAPDPAFPRGRPIYIGYRSPVRDQAPSSAGSSTDAENQVQVKIRLWTLTDGKRRAVPLSHPDQSGTELGSRDGPLDAQTFIPTRIDSDRDLLVAKGLTGQGFDEFGFAKTPLLNAPGHYRLELEVAAPNPSMTGEYELLVNHPFRYK